MRRGPLPEHEKENLRRLYKGKSRLYRRTTQYGKQLGIKYHSIRRGAENRKIEFLVTRAEAEEFFIMPCHYCGKMSDNIGHTNTYRTAGINGLDRIDSNKPYALDNIVACCKRCNHAKNDMTVEEFKEWLERAYLHIVGIVR
jgi:5-methylcytosine-specific restriction endonuclease McrA